MISVTTGPPVFEIKPKNEIVNEGSNVTFQCNATSNPSPTLSWTKDGNAINQSSNNIILSQDSQTLTINNVRRNDAGIYVCNATNNVNYVSTSAYLKVQCKYEARIQTSFLTPLSVRNEPIMKGTKNRTLIEGKIHSISSNNSILALYWPLYLKSSRQFITVLFCSFNIFL